jgi:hypothetical protein
MCEDVTVTRSLEEAQACETLTLCCDGLLVEIRGRGEDGCGGIGAEQGENRQQLGEVGGKASAAGFEQMADRVGNGQGLEPAVETPGAVAVPEETLRLERPQELGRKERIPQALGVKPGQEPGNDRRAVLVLDEISEGGLAQRLHLDPPDEVEIEQ